MRKFIRIMFIEASCFAIIFLSNSMSVLADEQSTIQVLEDFAVDTDTVTDLYNVEDELVAYYFEGTDGGYAIIDTENDLVEFSYSSEIDEFGNRTWAYYGGPTEYLLPTDDDGKVYNLNTNNVCDKDEVLLFESVRDDSDIKYQSVTISYPSGVKDSEGNSSYTSTLYKTLTLKKCVNLKYETRYFSYNTYHLLFT